MAPHQETGLDKEEAHGPASGAKGKQAHNHGRGCRLVAYVARHRAVEGGHGWVGRSRAGRAVMVRSGKDSHDSQIGGVSLFIQSCLGPGHV